MKYSRNYQTPSLARLHLVWVALCFCVTIGFSEDDQDNDNVCLDPETNEDPDYIWEGEPDCEYAKYTLSISPPDEGDVFAVGSGSTGSASASRITASGTTPKTDEISWSGDVSGTGATSSDFTTSVGAKSLTASFGGFSDSVGVTVVGVASVECVGTTSTTDEPGTDETVYIRKGNSGETVTLTAATNPADTSWPEGNPTWAGGDVVNNNDGSASFPIDEVSDSKNGTTVTVTCGTSKKSIKIVVFDVQRLSLSCLGTPAGIHLGDIPGRSEKVAYFSQVTLAGVLGVSPKDLDILEVRLSQYLCGHISL